MPSVLKSLLDNLSSRITENKSDITTIEENITQLDTALSTVQTEVETARGGSASLDTRLDNMTTATENAQSDASTAQTTANEAAASANTANSNIAAAADTFDSLKARLVDMTKKITNVTSEVTTARGSYSNLNARFKSVDADLKAAQNDATKALGTANTANTTANTAINTTALLRFSSIGKFMNTTAMSSYNKMSVNKPYYFDANGNTTSQTNSVITFTKYANNPMFFDISISNILTVTTDDLIAPTSPITITVQSLKYNVYFIMLPYSTFNPEALDNICIMEPSPFIITNNPQAINVESIGSVTNTPVLSTTEAVRAYIPVLRPATNSGTIFRFLTTAINPDTKTVQYYFSNSGFAFGL